jgi:hypothetical protein
MTSDREETARSNERDFPFAVFVRIPDGGFLDLTLEAIDAWHLRRGVQQRIGRRRRLESRDCRASTLGTKYRWARTCGLIIRWRRMRPGALR